jgi:hypothetical protein
MALKSAGLAFLLSSAALWLPTFSGLEAQSLDSKRDHEDGCDRPPGPPNSPAVRSDAGPVVEARYVGVTRDYAHGVLGDALEAEGLLVRYDDGAHVVCDTVLAGPDRVFEDTSPRLADVDQDGLNDVVAVASHRQYGARLELYGYPGPGEAFQLLAHTAYIGTPYRWLAPAGIADFDGDGRVDIAYVETPHLGKTLKIVTPRGDQLVEIASQSGFSNHRIGEAWITGGVRDCGDGPEIVLADGAWRRLVAVRLVHQRLVSRDLGAFENAAGAKAALAC